MKAKKTIRKTKKIRNRREQKTRENRYNEMIRIESEDKRLIYNNCL